MRQLKVQRGYRKEVAHVVNTMVSKGAKAGRKAFEETASVFHDNPEFFKQFLREMVDSLSTHRVATPDWISNCLEDRRLPEVPSSDPFLVHLAENLTVVYRENAQGFPRYMECVRRQYNLTQEQVDKLRSMVDNIVAIRSCTTS